MVSAVSQAPFFSWDCHANSVKFHRSGAQINEAISPHFDAESQLYQKLDFGLFDLLTCTSYFVPMLLGFCCILTLEYPHCRA